jgi:hypothetical protein
VYGYAHDTIFLWPIRAFHQHGMSA